MLGCSQKIIELELQFCSFAYTFVQKALEGPSLSKIKQAGHKNFSSCTLTGRISVWKIDSHVARANGTSLQLAL